MVISAAKGLLAKDDKPVFFVAAEFSRTRDTFRALEIDRVPLLSYYSPTNKEEHARGPLDSSTTLGDERVEAEAIARFVEGQCGIPVKIERAMWPRLLLLLAVLGSIAAVGFYAFDWVVSVWTWIGNQTWLAMVVCFGLYFISISGTLYDIIRGVPMIGMSYAGKPEVFHSQSGNQYGMEGFIIGGLNLSAAIALIFLMRYASKVSESSVMATSLVAVAVFLFGFSSVINLYRYKSPWYRAFNF
jgi:hypothetical protein